MKFIISVIGLIIVLALVGLILPSTTQLERKISINVEKQVLHDYLNNIKNFNQWSPWAELDPNTVYTYDGPDSGVGAVMGWKSDNNNVGEGKQEIIASDYDKGIKVLLNFVGQGDAFAEYILVSTEPGVTEMTWRFDADFGYDIIGRYFGLMMDSMLGPSYEQGLAKLKQTIEKQPATELQQAS